MRLVTRSDFDGLVCAVLLKERGLITEYKFAHPKDLQDGLIEITDDDILANKEALQLIRAYYAMPEAQRRQIFELARVLSHAA